MKHPLRVALATTLFATAAALVPSIAASATTARPWLTLSQATGLRQGQIVTVNGSGLVGGRRYTLLECPHGATDANDCARDGETAFPTASASGTFSVTMQVVRRPWGTLGRDCAVRYKCEIGATAFTRSGATVTAEANVWFSATAAPILPGFSVSPSHGLTPNQLVTIKAWGLAPNAFFRLSECSGLAKNDDDFFQDCAFNYGGGGGGGGPGPPGLRSRATVTPLQNETSPAGTVDVVERANSQVLTDFDRNNSPVNCEVAPGCELAAQVEDPADPTFAPQVALTFNPVAKPLTPVMQVSQTTNLASGQIVKVTGGPFIPNAPVVVRECPTDTPIWESCVIEDETEQIANTAGDATIYFPLIEKASVGKSSFDCAQIQCSITMVGPGDIWFSSWTPISFNAALKPINPKMGVTPATSLVGGQIVTVSAGAFPPGASLFLEECVRNTSSCDGLGNNVMADAAGGGEFGANVSSQINIFDPQTDSNSTIDCGLSSCDLALVNSSDGHESAHVAISFRS